MRDLRFKPGNKLKRARRAGQSQGSTKPNTPTERCVRRLTRDEYDLVVRSGRNGEMVLPDADGNSTGVRILRPKPARPDATTQYLEGTGEGEYRIYQKDKYESMWNAITREHMVRNECNDPTFTVNYEEKRGLCWIQSMRCIRCDYISEKYKLYDEVEARGRGRRAAKPNLGLHVGLQECPMGCSKLQVLLASMNVPPPSLNGMHKTSKKVADLTSAQAEEDLKQRRQNLKEVNTHRGLSEDEPVNISVDVRYNSTTITGRSKLGQNASSAIGVAVENHTDQHQVVGLYVENKLCYQGAWLRNKGFNVTCPGGHAGCSATYDDVMPFSEYEIGKELGKQMALDNILVKYVTTDGDAKSAEGVQFAMSSVNPLLQVVRQADTTHMGQSLFRHTLKACFSDHMFLGCNSSEKKEQQKMFALDLRYRCMKMFQVAHHKCHGNTDQMTKVLRTAVESTLDCYAGDCSGCKKKQSLVCKGGRKHWRACSHYLAACGFMDMNISDSDKRIIRELMNFYLGAEAVKLMKTNSTTNYNEAVNRSISSSLPKNVNYPRTIKARALSAVCRVNKGAGNSVVEGLESIGCSVSKGGYVAKALRRVQTRHAYSREYAKRDVVRAAKHKRMIKHMYKYMRAKQNKRIHESYIKGQLDPRLTGASRTRPMVGEVVGEHSYYRNEPVKQKRHDHPYVKCHNKQ